MQEQSFEQMLLESMKEIYPGDIIEGVVISVSDSFLVLNIGYKADGIVKRSDFVNDPTVDLRTLVNVGDSLTVKVKKLNDGEGQVVLSRKELIKEDVDKKLKAIYEEGGIKKGKVIRANDGGLVIEVEPMVNVFMPKSLISNKVENDLNKYIGQELEFYITEFKPQKGRCIADRKKIIVDEEKKKKEEALKNIKADMVIEGTVQSIVDYGVFVDLGGVSGLLHISEIGWGKMKNPKKLFNVGDKIKVLVREVDGDKISLTAKFPNENPWLLAREQYAIGNTVKGKVARMTDYGAFIALNDDIDGLLHVSEISWKRVKKPSDVLTIGQEIEVKVIDFNEHDKKISLSMKALEEAPKKEDDEEIVDVDIEKYSENNSENE